MWILKKYLPVFYISVLMYCLESNARNLEGKACPMAPGTCKRIKHCPKAIESMRKTYSHGLVGCGYSSDFATLVCCPPVIEKLPDIIVLNTSHASNSSSEEPTSSKPFPTESDNDTNNFSEGSKCRHSGKSGICKRMKDCDADSSKLTTKCGDELVCCPIFRKYKNSREFCDKFSEDFRRPPTEFISDGVEAAPGEYRHMAVLGYRSHGKSEPTWICGASIISTKFLLTAAHCIRNKIQIKPTVARLRVIKLDEENPRDVPIKETIIHHGYDPSNMHHDIGLIRLSQNLIFDDKIYPACLYYEEVIPLTLTITGWGKTSNDNTTEMNNALKEALLNREPNDKCHDHFIGNIIKEYRRNITDSQICATYNTGDMCPGDSGGPIQIKTDGIYFVVGIASFGTKGCDRNIYGVYTKVSKYIEWIDKIVFGI